MTYTVLYFLYRKPGLTPEEFRTYNEDIRLVKTKQIAGDKSPLSYVHHYIHRSSEPPYTATILFTGSSGQTDVEYDAVAEMNFENEEAFKAFVAVFEQPDNKKWLEEDDKKFLDQTKQSVFVVLEGVKTQTRA